MESAQEFESESSNVGRWKQKMQEGRGSSSVFPPKIIENILCRLPVKDLLRFKVVCKQWEATISDPIFAEIHLQHHKNSSSRNHLLAWENPPPDFKGFDLTEIRNNCIEFVSAYEHSREYDFALIHETFCSCDGLYLKCSPTWKQGQQCQPFRYVLWNPSCRTYRELYSPLPADFCWARTIHAIYYNPLMKDYKIVIADWGCYAVYSCRDNKWGDVKQREGFSGDKYECTVSVDGSIYWLVVDYCDPEVNGGNWHYPRDIIYFDCKNETFKRLPLPNYKNREEKMLYLTSIGGHLCLLICKWKWNTRIKIMKRVSSSDGNNGWMESKEESLCSYIMKNHPKPLCVLSENETLLLGVMVGQMVYLLYDKSKNTIQVIQKNYKPKFHGIPRPYLENLLQL